MATPTYVPLATITLASTDSEITFSSIPATYRDLILIFDGTGSVALDTSIYFNGDTTSGNYSAVSMGASAGGTFSNTFLSSGVVSGSTISDFVVQVMDYSASDKHKTSIIRNGSTSQLRATTYRWANTSVVNSLSFRTQTGNFLANTTISLYGIA